MLADIARSDRLAQPAETEQIEQGRATIIRTKGRQDYWFGNYLMLESAPTAEDLDDYLDVWRSAFGNLPQAQRLILQWEGDSREPLSSALVERARQFDLQLAVNTALEHDRNPRTVPDAKGWQVRPARSSKDWDDVLELCVVESSGELPRDYVHWRYDAYRARTQAGFGDWWGLWLGDQLIGSAGLLRQAYLARFQEVRTHRAFRRRGVCTHLCATMISERLAAEPRAKLYVVAEPQSSAERIYRRLGFEPIGYQYALIGPPIGS